MWGGWWLLNGWGRLVGGGVGGLRWRFVGMLRCWDGLWRFVLSKNPRTRWSMYHSTSHLYIPPWKLRWLAGKSRVFSRGDTSTPNGCLSVVMSRTPCRPNWLPSNPCRSGVQSQIKFFWTSLGILRVSMQNVTKNHTNMSHSSVISEDVTSSFQWESILTGLLPYVFPSKWCCRNLQNTRIAETRTQLLAAPPELDSDNIFDILLLFNSQRMW